MAKLVKGPISVKAFKTKLRRVALALPAAEVRKAVLSIKSRAQAVYEAKGGDIARD